MDVQNRFHTKETWAWVRIEQCGLVVGLAALVLSHSGDVRWGRFAAAFLLIDLLGYIPGAVAWRRREGATIAPVYHHLYNITHSYITAALVCAAWAMAAGGPEWAMLAFPIHLAGDRGIFGNVYKPISLPFEPTPSVSAPDRGAPVKVAAEASR